MPDPLALTVATVLATKGAEAAVAGARSAVGGLVRLVRERMGTDVRAAAALQAAMRRPDRDDRRLELATALARLLAEDPSFERQVRVLWSQAAVELGHDGVVNHFSGTADRVVQARDIRGDVNF